MHRRPSFFFMVVLCAVAASAVVSAEAWRLPADGATVRLAAGVYSADLTAIEGTLVVRLPLDVTSVELGENGGRESTGLKLTVMERTPESITAGWEGAIDRLLTIVGYDSGGASVRPASHWITGRGSGERARELLATAEKEGDEQARRFARALLEPRLHDRFAAPVATVRAVTAGRFIERRYPFRLTR